jgi:prevent-host-death family protein
MKIASVADVKARLSAFLKESQKGPVVVTRNGKPVAVLLAVTDEDELERLVLAYSPKFQEILEKSRRQIEAGGGIPHDVFWREVEAENREEVRKGRQVEGRQKRRRCGTSGGNRKKPGGEGNGGIDVNDSPSQS